ncbi:hypothetical protein COSHB9_08960 [Companilactobacillus alimentarius]|uniref:NADH:ubiquinone oxidoreductase n=1 Tax=Companilactobacillus alimentarius DSM 20249 TaxID=1423720 RepID=A0A2K9HJW1_9LACO|nr:hypothetical protein LA20249_08240 [Companilactobacillus alimentarius DSM 20249]
MRKIKIWWLINVFWILLYIVTTLFLCFRQVDATGAIQNYSTKLINIAIISIVFLIIAICQLVIFHFIKK